MLFLNCLFLTSGVVNAWLHVGIWSKQSLEMFFQKTLRVHYMHIRQYQPVNLRVTGP